MPSCPSGELAMQTLQFPVPTYQTRLKIYFQTDQYLLGF